MVTAANFARLRPLNFGIRTLNEPLHVDVLVREIERYDAADAARVSELVRASAGREVVVDQLVDLYEQVIAEHRSAGPADVAAEGRAAAAYVRQLKIDFASHGAASMRLCERLERVPIFGRLGLKVIRKVAGEGKP